ncbi:MAG: hypothetical protein A2015_03075 [Spirochaetes bacterium GWF1_31_7]|nr:MAG: hypothetical protein A2Y30_16535 [Spirochaetes bacterium GWE1_32_154]OHD45309.1 MAG: hypothetical protein A2Y29_08265 [Spirochaetes bacterium GWE2_31_10]OHD50951.1 MAG: hypothetical protein A2015_03075 [Spirochaetes bacterium GWF1_31_7]OHD78393.1 MAG: hypothetical protein A2355_17275 [Spirochaetes bacterium RIFOXYB1_FULL_32_8]HBD95586.1 hypothetical protein [Spirochaetia bacterium]
MLNYKKNENTFTITNSGGSGCIFIFISFFGILLTLAGIFGILFTSSIDNDSKIFMTGIFIFMSSLGIIMIWAGFRSPARNFKESIIFDNESSLVKFYFNKTSQTPYEVSYGDIAFIEGVLDIRTTSNSGGSGTGTSTHHYYLINIVKKDGAVLWLTKCVDSVERYQDLITELVTFTGFALHQTPSLGEPLNATKFFQKASFPQEYTVNQNCVTIEKQDAGTKIQIHNSKKSFIENFFARFVYFPFFIVPVFMLYIFFNSLGFPMVLIPGIFCVIFYIILIAVLLSQLKKYTIIVEESGIDINITFRFFSFFNKSIRVSSEAINYVRTNRGEDGACRLTLGIEASAKPDISFFTMLLVNIGTFKPAQRKNCITNEVVIPLWEVPAYSQAGKTLTIFDLLAIEKIIEDIILLKEKSIE